MSGKIYRRKYYDVFSKIYDRFVALHSKDTQSNIREFLANITPISRGDRVLDICTGTGTLLLYLSRKVSDRGLVIGADFSRGMLEVAKQKVQFSDNVFLVESDVAFLPFKSASFDAVTCSHAFYELKGDVQDQVLKDIVRILKPGKPFLMMEHDLPENKFVRFLLYIRFFSMGAKKAIEILKHEKEMLEKYFHSVKKVETPTGRSKVWICYKGG
ncbi:MAG: hypothetical protein DRG83_14455 [Deltaproteobacteria bacterium]|nr:MAG: hypothetical protein DRG83_14455 [Deltaproteobacteria bacterium]